MSRETGKHNTINERPRFGKIAVDLGFITEEQLKMALDEQVIDNLSNKPHINIGKILLNKKWITYKQIIAVLNKARENDHDVTAYINALKRDVRTLSLIVLLIASILTFINLCFLTIILDYMTPLSIAVLFLIVFLLVTISLYLSRHIVRRSVEELMKYDSRISGMLNSLRHEIEERKRSDEKYLSLVDSTDDSIYLVDSDYRLLFMNRIHLSRLGLSEDQYIDRPYNDFHSPEETELFMQKADKVFTSGSSMQYEYKSFREDKYFLQTLSPVKNLNDETTAITVISKEITMLKHAEEKLYTMSITDELTGLYNRRGFLTLSDQQLRLANRDNKKIFLMSADIDSLKQINDTAGHKRGDMAINSIANILKKTFRESDIAARIGGDEFVVLGMDTPETNINNLDERLRNNIKAYNARVHESLDELSLSYGFAFYDPECPCSIDELLINAERLMYVKKNKK